MSSVPGDDPAGERPHGASVPGRQWQDEGEYTDEDVAADLREQPDEGSYVDVDVAPGRRVDEDEGMYTDEDVPAGDRPSPAEGSYTDVDEGLAPGVVEDRGGRPLPP